jgi:uncharacterized protein YqjF (DUF2071 family)
MRYKPVGAPYVAKPGNLDDFLTNRLCLYSANERGRVYRADIVHVPWPLQSAEAEIESIAMTEQIGVKLPQAPPLLHFARFLDVVSGWPMRI